MTPHAVYQISGFKGMALFLGAHPTAECSAVLVEAAAKNDMDTVGLVLPHSDPKTDNSLAFRRAVNNGHCAMVDLLLPLSDPSVNKSVALLRAVENNDVKMVELLLPHSNPCARASEFLFRAVAHDLDKIAKILWPVSNVESVKKQWRANHATHGEQMVARMEAWEQQWLREALEGAVGAGGREATRLKM